MASRSFVGVRLVVQRCVVAERGVGFVGLAGVESSSWSWSSSWSHHPGPHPYHHPGLV
ncbi:hypothetical protein ACXZ9C_10715 [Streptococcus agalactiae]